MKRISFFLVLIKIVKNIKYLNIYPNSTATIFTIEMNLFVKNGILFKHLKYKYKI